MPVFAVAADTGHRGADAGKFAGVPGNRMPERKKRIRGGYISRV